MAYKKQSRLRGGMTQGGVPIVFGYLSPRAVLLTRGKVRGYVYEIYDDPEGGAKPIAAVVHEPYEHEDGTPGIEAEVVRRASDEARARSYADDYIERLWRLDMGLRRPRRRKNPLTAADGAAIGIFTAGALGLAGLAWGIYTSTSPKTGA